LFAWIDAQITQAPKSSGLLTLTVPLPRMDPLAVLRLMMPQKEQFFYWEQPGGTQIFVSIGQISCLELSGPQRFQQARNFIDSCLADICALGFAGVEPIPSRFCCGFTFFEDVQEGCNPFPGATVFLPRWQVLRQYDRCWLTAHLSLSSRIDLRSWSEEVVEFMQQTLMLTEIGSVVLPNRLLERHQPDNTVFLESVRQGLQAITAGQLHKVVLAQAMDVTTQQAFSPWSALQRLRYMSPECHSFALGNSLGQVFMGATPEGLLTVQDGILYTKALAGSSPRGETETQDSHIVQVLRNNPKELHEHQLVADFIIATLRQLGINPQLAKQPQIVSLVNIHHLQTPIWAALPAHLHPLDILAQLHPTPAVAGLPLTTAEQLIRCLEDFERSLYAAPIGWLDSAGNCEFMVGIRSALLDGNRARLFAGAGIVAGSDPERELAEVTLKRQPLLAALLGTDQLI
jgi:menaquinone-specific isochorismate synthase